MKTPERCHAVFIFNFEHIQQNNQIFFIVNFDMYLSNGQRMESTKRLKRTLNNGVVFFKHVHVTSISQHGWKNPEAIESNVHIIIVMTEL